MFEVCAVVFLEIMTACRASNPSFSSNILGDGIIVPPISASMTLIDGKNLLQYSA